jgi:flagellar protein FliO/FliZ
MTGGSTSMLGSLAAFIAILILIPAVLWLLKRTPMGVAASQGHMRLVATLPLAPNQRIVTVEVGQGDERKWLVLGVTAGGITTLHTLPPQGEAPTLPQHALSFAQLLARTKATASGKEPDGAR